MYTSGDRRKRFPIGPAVGVGLFTSLWIAGLYGPAVVAGIDIGTRSSGSVAPAVQSVYPACEGKDSLGEPLGNGRAAELTASELGKDAVCLVGNNLFVKEPS